MSAGRATEALAAARRAVALEPRYWGNQFRLAHAAWGEERLQALARARDLYQDFPFVHFEMAMVHIARGHLERAEPVLREGTVVQDRQADRKQRYPAKGLHWLLGLVRLASGDTAEALAEFEGEIASGSWQLYGPEFAMNAHDGAGFAYLARREPAAAVEAFRKALALFPDHARSLVGLGAALAEAGDADGSQAALAQAATAIEALRRGGRTSEAHLAEAMSFAVRGDGERSLEVLHALLDKPDMPFSGWTIPIEPLLASLRKHSDYQRVTGRLSERAR
jgi:tetratricopeptide (TPR) repeat protein